MNQTKVIMSVVFTIVLLASMAVAEEVIRLTPSGNVTGLEGNESVEVTAEIPGNQNATVEYGLYVLNLGKFDIATGAFTVDFYLSMRCPITCVGQEFEFMNGRASSMEKIIDTPNEKFYRIQAQLNSPVDLKKYPFDTQQMQIILEDKRMTTDSVRYGVLGEESGIDESIAFTGWHVQNWSAEVRDHYYPAYDETFSQFVFTIPISRVIINSIIKTFLPIIFILLVMLSSFILDPDKMTTRLSMVGSALVASVMFHVSLTNQLPPVGYLTIADKFMMLTYFVILLSFGLNVALMQLSELKRQDVVERVHRMTEYSMFVVVPLLYVLLFVLVL